MPFSSEISSKAIYDDHVIEVTPEGQIVWQWRTSEHFDELGNRKA